MDCVLVFILNCFHSACCYPVHSEVTRSYPYLSKAGNPNPPIACSHPALLNLLFPIMVFLLLLYHIPLGSIPFPNSASSHPGRSIVPPLPFHPSRSNSARSHPPDSSRTHLRPALSHPSCTHPAIFHSSPSNPACSNPEFSLRACLHPAVQVAQNVVPVDCPPGLEYLTLIDQMIIKQKVGRSRNMNFFNHEKINFVLLIMVKFQNIL